MDNNFHIVALKKSDGILYFFFLMEIIQILTPQNTFI